jgi:hypothetical protein
MYTFNWLLCFESDQLQWLPHNFMIPYVPVREFTRPYYHGRTSPYEHINFSPDFSRRLFQKYASN